MSTLTRRTRETQVRLTLRRRTAGAGRTPDLDPDSLRSHEAPADQAAVRTTEPFLNHMLETFARYADVELDVEATGDLRHHLIEDVAITLGLAVKDEIPPACRRYGDAIVVMDDAMVQVALDAGGRPYYRGPLPSRLYDHFFRSFADNAAITLHARVLRGTDRHHIVEAAVKALGLALRRALSPADALFSTKGSVQIEREE
jgi:imidazoleglycerol-phosphate dehydratase